MKRIDLSGQTFGRLLVIGYLRTQRERAFWTCQCRCGNRCVVCSGDLRSGSIKSCGCLRAETIGALRRTHAKSSSPEFQIWNQMKQRCLNPNNKRYSQYGGRGIKVCDQWLTFEGFYSDMGARPATRYSIERVDNDGDYEPSNCIWLPTNQQQINRTNTVRITYNNETHHLAEWARRIGITARALTHRREAGWSIEAMLTTPSLIRRRQQAA